MLINDKKYLILHLRLLAQNRVERQREQPNDGSGLTGLDQWRTE